MRHVKFKQFVLLLVLLLPAAWCGANGIHILECQAIIKQHAFRYYPNPKQM